MVASKLRKQAQAALLSVVLSGCASSAHFYSKNGQVYPEVTQQAVICEENEIQTVMAAGGFPIGVIESKALMVVATERDLVAKAAKIAAKNGGTHVLLTERGINTFTVTTPDKTQRECIRTRGEVDCREVYTPGSTSTYEKPTAQFVVFAVPPQGWARLPPALQPRPER